MNIGILRTTNLDGPVLPEPLAAPLYMNENQAHQFCVACKKKGQTVSLTGGISGRFIRPDGDTILLTGSITAGVAYVTLPQACYILPGRFILAIFNTENAYGATTTIYAATGNIARTQSGALIDPGRVVPSIDGLLAEIDAMRQATAEANAVAEKAVRYDVAQQLTDDNKARARNNIDVFSRADVSAAISDAESASAGRDTDILNNRAVRYDATQTIDATKQATARSNIGAASATEVNEINTNRAVRYDTVQTLSDENQATARGNIGAASAQDVSDLNYVLGNTMRTDDGSRRFVLGSINVSNGADVESDTRLCTIKTRLDNVCVLSAASGYEIMLYCYDSEGEYVGVLKDGGFIHNINWITGATLYDMDSSIAFYRVVLRRTDDSAMTTEDSAGCLFTYYKDPVLTRDTNSIASIVETFSDTYVVYDAEDGTDRMGKGAIGGTGADVDDVYTNTSFRSNGYLEVNGAQAIISEVVEIAETNYYHYINFYDNSHTFISRAGGSHVQRVFAEVPVNAMYFRVSLTQIKAIADTTTNIESYVCRWAIENRVGLSPKNKWYVLGDSISAGYYSMTESMAEAAGVTLNYTSPVTTDAGETTGSVWDKTLSHNYWGYANRWHMKRELIGKAYPGQGYIRKSSNSQNGVYVVTHNDFSDAGLITVAWGFNDWHYNRPRGDHELIDPSVPYPGENYDTTQITTINQAIWFCLGELIRQAPNARIVVQTPMNGWAYGGDFASNWGLGYEMSQSGKLSDIHDDIVHWANYYGLQILDMTYNNSIVNRRNIKETLIDGSHPSDLAHQQLGRTVGVALNYC